MYIDSIQLTLFALAQAFGAGYLIVYSVVALNSMSKKTRWSIRAAYVVLATAAMWCIFSSLIRPDAMAALLVWGIVLYIKLSKRKPPNQKEPA